MNNFTLRRWPAVTCPDTAHCDIKVVPNDKLGFALFVYTIGNICLVSKELLAKRVTGGVISVYLMGKTFFKRVIKGFFLGPFIGRKNGHRSAHSQ